MFTYRLQRDNLGRPGLRNTAVCQTYTCKVMKTKSAICYRHKRKDETGERSQHKWQECRVLKITKKTGDKLITRYSQKTASIFTRSSQKRLLDYATDFKLNTLSIWHQSVVSHDSTDSDTCDLSHCNGSHVQHLNNSQHNFMCHTRHIQSCWQYSSQSWHLENSSYISGHADSVQDSHVWTLQYKLK